MQKIPRTKRDMLAVQGTELAIWFEVNKKEGSILAFGVNEWFLAAGGMERMDRFIEVHFPQEMTPAETSKHTEFLSEIHAKYRAPYLAWTMRRALLAMCRT